MPPLTASKAAASAQGASIVHAYVPTPYGLSAHPTASMLVTAFPSPGSIGGVPPPATRPLCGRKVLGGTTGTKRFSSILSWTACPRHSNSALSISEAALARWSGSAHATIRTARVMGFFALVALEGTDEGRDLARRDLRQLLGAWLGRDQRTEMLGQVRRSPAICGQKRVSTGGWVSAVTVGDGTGRRLVT